ncbi:MAG: flavin-containing monooxygenase, partial [Candidatus Limnocylindrales bacterium]
GWIDLPVFGEGGWPNERRGVVDGQPGLYFLGIPFLYSFTSMLVLGAGRDAGYVVDRLTARAADRSRDVSATKARSTAA